MCCEQLLRWIRAYLGRFLKLHSLHVANVLAVKRASCAAPVKKLSLQHKERAEYFRSSVIARQPNLTAF